MKRIDETLVMLGFAESRAKAQALISENKVFCGEKLIDKPSRKVSLNDKIKVEEGSQLLKYVSRAGLKLEAYLDKFNIDVKDDKVLDAGASTGGFSHCCLLRGAKQIYCVDVGSGQLHQKLLANKSIVNMPNTDIRNLTPKMFNDDLFDFICADLSFISLEKVLDVLWALLKKNAKLVCLVKPQFEVNITIAKKNKGIIKDQEIQKQCLEKIKNFVNANIKNAEFIGEITSPIKGGDGNVEFLIGYKKKGLCPLDPAKGLISAL